MILCVGPTGAGKTSLLRLLSQSGSSERLSATVPTTGTNMVYLPLNKKTSITVHELGGSMAPIWERHLGDCRTLLYVIDGRNLQQVSCATVCLMELLSSSALMASVPVLVVMNKVDLSATTTLREFRDIMHLQSICQQARQHVSVVETSCLTAAGVDQVKNWLLLQIDSLPSH